MERASPDPTNDDSCDNEQTSSTIADLVGSYVERLNAGETIDKQAVREEHPKLAEQILDELEVFIDSVADDEPPVTLGDFECIREIGRGGMGVVYRAWQRSMDREVALKILPPGLAADAKSVSRFVREAQVAGKLNHPSVVAVYGMGVERAVPYFAMELVDGVTLAAILGDPDGGDESGAGAGVEGLVRRLGESTQVPGNGEGFAAPDHDVDRTAVRKRTFSRLATAFSAVAQGLEHAHSRGVIHRDIKPSNLIVDREGQIRILDFGLARLEGQETVTLTGDVLGTLQYMSPEQTVGERDRIGPRADIYSLGATLYEVLTLRPPFRGRTREDIGKLIREADPVDPRRLDPRIPRDLESIVLRCLEKSPGRRYGTAEALAQDLERFARGDAVEARPISRWERAARKARRHRGKLVALASVLVLLLGVGWLEHGRSRAELDRRRAVYQTTVLSTLVEVFRGQMMLSGQELPSLAFFQAQRYKAPGDRAAASGVEATVASFEALAHAAPERPEALYFLGRLLLMLGREDEAIDAANAALESDPSFVPAEVLRERIVRGVHRLGSEELDPILERYSGSGTWQEAWLLAYRHHNEQRWQDAATAFGDLLSHRERAALPDEPYVGCGIEAAMGLGIAALRGGDPTRAQREFAGARRMWPRFREAALLLAKAYHVGGQPDEAQRVFEELYEETEPEEKDEAAEWIARLCYMGLRDADAGGGWGARVGGWRQVRLRGYLAFFSGDHDAAVEAAEVVLRQEPEDLSALLSLAYGRLHRQYGLGGEGWDAERRSLLAFTTEFVELYPRSNMANAAHALTLLAVGRREEAAAAAERIRRVEANAGISTIVGPIIESRILRSSGRFAEAEQAMRTIDMHEPNLFALLEKAQVLQATGNDDEALAYGQRLVQIHPNWAPSHSELARLLARRGEPEDLDLAIRHAQRATELLPRNSAAWETLAAALLAAGRLDDALEAADDGLSRLPDRVSIHVVRGDILAARGDVGGACAGYGAALALDPERSDAHAALTALLASSTDTIEPGELAAVAEKLRSRLGTAPSVEGREVLRRTIADLDRAVGAARR